MKQHTIFRKLQVIEWECEGAWGMGKGGWLVRFKPGDAGKGLVEKGVITLAKGKDYILQKM